MEGRQCRGISEATETLPDGEGAALCQLPVPQVIEWGQRMVTQKRSRPRRQLPGQVTSATKLTELLQAVLDCSGGERMPSNSGYQTAKKAGTVGTLMTPA